MQFSKQYSPKLDNLFTQGKVIEVKLVQSLKQRSLKLVMELGIVIEDKLVHPSKQ